MSNNVQNAGDSNLQQQLLDLQQQNARLRQENEENIRRLQSVTEEMQQAFQARMDRMDEEFRNRLAKLGHTPPELAHSVPTTGTVPSTEYLR